MLDSLRQTWRYSTLRALMWMSLVLGLIVETAGLVEEKNPPTASVSVLRVVVHMGEDVRISCPIEGKPTPYFEWSKEGILLDYSWYKYKAHRKYLKIKGVSKEDTGILFCKGINGYGSAQVKVELYVADSENTQEVTPILTDETLNLNTLYKKMIGEPFSLQCLALGVPPPNVTWMFDRSTVSSTGRMYIPSLAESHSGVYTCLATSSAGQCSRQFYLTVEAAHIELPSIHQTSNLTVYQGQNAVLECTVESKLRPDIQWLQESEGEEYSITLASMKLIHAGDSEVKQLSDNKYLSSLAVNSAAQSQVYVCLATNPAGGFSFNRSYLQVQPVLYLEVLPLVLSVLVGLVVLLILVVTCLMRSRQKLILSQYQASTYSTHVYDVPQYSPVSYSTMSTPISTRKSGSSSTRYFSSASNRGLEPFVEEGEEWRFIKNISPYSDIKFI